VNQSAVLVTGAGRRIGAFIAEHFGRRNYHVFVHVHRSREDGTRIVERIVSAGGSATLVAADLGKADEIAAMVETILASGDNLETVVNNASYFAYDSAGRADAALLESSLDAHVRGPFAIFEALSHRLPGKPLAFFNLLDQKLVNFNPDYYSYTIGKAGLFAMTRMWQAQEPPRPRVFGILLGLTLASNVQSPENYERASKSNLLQRAVTPADITAAIDFFLDNADLPGQTLALDCGESLVPRARDVAFDPGLL
jgi:NAD(P)-dependent dehydrogenase (short-subunit alcohol dehydrogenase family)